MSMPPKAGFAAAIPWLVMLASPLFFSTNLIFGRSLNGDIDPFLLAFVRWMAVALILLPFVLREREEAFAVAGRHWRLLVAAGFCGMFVSGAIVYLALRHTTATNGTLIYTTSPVIILLLEAAFLKRAIGKREVSGMILAFAGAALIILKGDIAALARFSFNPGDLLIALAAVTWAIYTLLTRNPAFSRLSTLASFGLFAAFGALTLLPPVATLGFAGRLAAPSVDALPAIGGIIAVSSLLAFSTFQYGVRRLGATVAGLFMYLMPPYGVFLAVMLLGERVEPWHLHGIALVLAGIILATFPAKLLKRR